MTTINFPSAPLVNQLYSYNGKTWQYNGVGWAAAQTNTGTASAVVVVSSTAPSIPVLGQEWEDLVSGTKFTWMGSGWVELGSAGGGAVPLAPNYGDTQNPYAAKTANYILAAPNVSAGVPTFRALVAADVPVLNQNTTGTAVNVTGIVAAANGGTGLTAPGAPGNVLQSNGTSWTSAPPAVAASGGITLLATVTPTAAANVDFLNVFSSTYDNYLIIVDGVLGSASGAPTLQMQVGISGSASTGSIYYGSSANNTTFSTATTSFQSSTPIDYQSGAVGGNVNIKVNNVNSTTGIKTIDALCITQSNSLGNFISNRNVCALSVAFALSGVRFFWSNGGNFQAVGSIRVYGYKNS